MKNKAVYAGAGLAGLLALVAPAAGAGPGGGPQAVMTTGAHAPAGGEGPLRLLFIHHSVGGQLMADEGALAGGESRAGGEYCIHRSHPNGGGLRRLLEAAGYEVHEASYGSRLGEDTDIRHWPPKFADRFDEMLRCDRQDRAYPDARRNRIVAFKSCYPNNDFRGEGREPGDPAVPELTVANARAAYHALLPIFRQHPDVLFVAFTTPAMARPQPAGLRQKFQAWRESWSGRGRLAREFNGWLADRGHGWLAGYELPNVVVFDYYTVLSGGDPDGWSAFATQGGLDSHPSAAGNRAAAAAFVPLLDRASAAMGWRTGR